MTTNENSYGREIRQRINRNAEFLRYLTTLLYLFLCGHYISRNANKNFMTNYLNFNGVDFLCILANKKQNIIQFQINVDWRLAASKIFVLKKWMQFFFSFYASTITQYIFFVSDALFCIYDFKGYLFTLIFAEFPYNAKCIDISFIHMNNKSTY